MWDQIRKSFDPEHGVFKTIDFVHDRVHQGRMFMATYKTPDGSPLSDNAAITFLIAVGAREIHTNFSGACGGEGEIALYEGANTSGGTNLQFAGMNRVTGFFVPSTSILLDPSVSAYGVLLYNMMFPGGTGGQRVGGQQRENTEWLLRPNTDYLLQMINRAGNNQQASLLFQWYEQEE